METLRRTLTLFDSTCLIVGIIVGVGIHQVAPEVARGAGGPWALLGLWVLGGVLSLCGAMCYAELATALPRSGGDYVYLNRAFGPLAGFLFGWAQLAIVRPGDIAVMAFAYATYAATFHSPGAEAGFLDARQLHALGAVGGLTLINVLGVRQGKWTQNLLTVVKVGGLLLIGVVAFLGRAKGTPEPGPDLPASLALILVLFTYGGWNEMAYVAAEVREPQRNIARALLLGTLGVTGLYLIVNGAFLRVLGFDGLRASSAVSADTVAAVLPGPATGLVSALICLSALGAANGLILTGARISYAMGRDHPLFGVLGRWDARRGTPVTALWLQGLVSCGLVVVLGSFLNAVLYTAAIVYGFYLATALALVVLRRREPALARPWRVPGYPVTPLLFAAVCVFLIHAAVIYNPKTALGAVGLLLLGVPLYLADRARRRGFTSS